MGNKEFMSRSIEYVCDSDLFAIWSLFCVLNSSFGEAHVMRRDSVLSEAWNNLFHIIEKYIEEGTGTNVNYNECLSVTLFFNNE